MDEQTGQLGLQGECEILSGLLNMNKMLKENIFKEENAICGKYM